jgi:hypothetical protein
MRPNSCTKTRCTPYLLRAHTDLRIVELRATPGQAGAARDSSSSPDVDAPALKGRTVEYVAQPQLPNGGVVVNIDLC